MAAWWEPLAGAALGAVSGWVSALITTRGKVKEIRTDFEGKLELLREENDAKLKLLREQKGFERRKQEREQETEEAAAAADRKRALLAAANELSNELRNPQDHDNVHLAEVRKRVDAAAAAAAGDAQLSELSHLLKSASDRADASAADSVIARLSALPS